jgi:pimeloyl-ACP methyl ester carboxylesterase
VGWQHDSVVLAGLSFGGGVAQHYALRFPSHVERLLLVASVGSPEPSWRPIPIITRAFVAFTRWLLFPSEPSAPVRPPLPPNPPPPAFSHSHCRAVRRRRDETPFNVGRRMTQAEECLERIEHEASTEEPSTLDKLRGKLWIARKYPDHFLPDEMPEFLRRCACHANPAE